jgi:hypothetical protein
MIVWMARYCHLQKADNADSAAFYLKQSKKLGEQVD